MNNFYNLFFFIKMLFLREDILSERGQPTLYIMPVIYVFPYILVGLCI